MQTDRGTSRWRGCAVCACLLAVTLASFATASAEPYKRDGTPDASGQWKYVLESGNATITGYVIEPSGDLVIPSELDGYAVRGIGEDALAFSENVVSVIIPDSVIHIGITAFEGCIRLTSVAIPGSVTNIGSGTFKGCSRLTSVVIPVSVVYIGQNPFMYCPLEYVHVVPSNPAYEDVDGVLFDKERKSLVSYPGAREGAYTIPDSVLFIGDGALMGGIGLTDVIIPDSITEIGYGAFNGCIDLTSVTIPNGVKEIGEQAFSQCDKLTLRVAEGSYAEQYAKNNGLPYILIKNGT